MFLLMLLLVGPSNVSQIETEDSRFTELRPTYIRFSVLLNTVRLHTNNTD